MARTTALADLLSTVLERGARLVDFSGETDDDGLVRLCRDLMSARGEASGVALAGEILSRYQALDVEGRRAFFRHLANDYNPDPAAVLEAAQAYADAPEPDAMSGLFDAVEPPRQELLRRLNLTPGGTECLVRMRADLLPLLRESPDLAAIDADFRHPAAILVQPRFPGVAAHGLVDARVTAGEDHQVRGGAPHRRLGRTAPPARAAGPALFRVLPSGDAR